MVDGFDDIAEKEYSRTGDARGYTSTGSSVRRKSRRSRKILTLELLQARAFNVTHYIPPQPMHRNNPPFFRVHIM